MIKTSFLSLVLSFAFALSGCGVGAMYFEPVGSGPPSGAAAANFQSFDVDCQDGFEKATGDKAGLSVSGSVAGTYSVACTKDGKPMPGTVLGLFHAAPLANGKWDQYRIEVVAKARDKGCPGVAVRKTAPTVNQGGEAIGAFCVQL